MGKKVGDTYKASFHTGAKPIKKKKNWKLELNIGIKNGHEKWKIKIEIETDNWRARTKNVFLVRADLRAPERPKRMQSPLNKLDRARVFLRLREHTHLTCKERKIQ